MDDDIMVYSRVAIYIYMDCDAIFFWKQKTFALFSFYLCKAPLKQSVL